MVTRIHLYSLSLITDFVTRTCLPVKSGEMTCSGDEDNGTCHCDTDYCNATTHNRITFSALVFTIVAVAMNV